MHAGGGRADALLRDHTCQRLAGLALPGLVRIAELMQLMLCGWGRAMTLGWQGWH